MNIDPRNPLFCHIDKVVVAVAVLVALLALKGIWAASPAKEAVANTQQAIEKLERHVGSQPITTRPRLVEFRELAQRFAGSSIEGNAFRMFVFYSPDEVVGREMIVSFRADTELKDRKPGYYYIASEYPELKDLDYGKAKVIIGNKSLVDLIIDVQKKALVATPHSEGVTIVRIEFAEGASFEFELTVAKIDVPPVPVPEPPVAVRAEGGRGYVSLTWQSHPESCPATSYKICRSDKIDSEKKFLVEIYVKGREKPDQGQPAVAKMRKYAWDDLEVSPGVRYYYAIETTGFVKREKQQGIETSNERSSQVHAVPLDPVSISLVGGAGDMATFEVEVYRGYVPRFKNFFARCGQPVGKKEFATRYTLVDVEKLPHERTRRILVKVKQDNTFKLDHRNVRYISDVLHAVLIDDKNEQLELWKKSSRKTAYARDVRKLFSELSALAEHVFPKLGEERVASRTPELKVANQADMPLTILMRSKKTFLKLNVLQGSSRTFLVPKGDYDILAGYLGEEASIIYHVKKLSVKEFWRYNLNIDRPKKKPGPKKEKEKEEAAQAGR